MALDKPATVYNFHVEGFECYYVSGQRVLVHHTCSPIKGYTKHGLNQAIGRDGGKGVVPKAILDTVKNPSKTVKQSGGRIKYISKKAVVVLNKDGKVITTYAKGSKYIRGAK